MTAVYLEVAEKRVFACALDWPGWCRSGKSEPQALDAFVAAAPRYAIVAVAAGLEFPTPKQVAPEVVGRVAGTASTQFGVPDALGPGDEEPLAPGEGRRLASLVAASWTVFDAVVARAPEVLRKGPRGGGRDRDAIAQHVVGAEAMYARRLGLRQSPPSFHDRPAVQTLRQVVLDALRSSGAPSRWPPRYAARRIAWHVLDHAWEIEDRAQ